MSAVPTPSVSSPTALLAVKGLGRRLERRWLWRGVELALKSQTRLGLVGPSGSGKTLLLRTLVHLEPIHEGEIAFAGRSLAQWSLPAYRTKVIYLPQRPALFDGTVEDNLQMVFQLAEHQQHAYDRGQILTFLSVLKREEDFLKQPAVQLSGGESQLLGLLRALQLQPQILLLDEPTASLDPESTRGVETLLEEWLRGDRDRACIWTSHDREQLQRVTDETLPLQLFLPDPNAD